MAKKTAVKTTTTKKPAKKAAKKEDGENKFQVNALAGLLTYNECKWESVEDIKQHHKELQAKTQNNIVLSTCAEKEARFHGHTMFHTDRS